MTATTEQARLFSQLQNLDGATPAEAVIVLATLADVQRVIDLVGPKGYVHGWKYVGVSSTDVRIIAPKTDPAIAAKKDQELETRLTTGEQKARRMYMAKLEAVPPHEMHRRTIAMIQKMNQRSQQMNDAQEAKDARTRFAGHAAFIAAGGIIGAAVGVGTAGLGLPLVAAAGAAFASSVTPALGQELFDYVKGL